MLIALHQQRREHFMTMARATNTPESELQSLQRNGAFPYQAVRLRQTL
jgi:hypothetical protein